MTKVYLAGKIHGISYADATEWRNRIKREVSGDYVFLDPMSGKEYLSNYDTIPISSEYSNADIFSRDTDNVLQSSIILANLNYLPMIGTMFELGYAYRLDKWLIYICDNEYKNHPFISESADHIVPDVDAAIKLLNAMAEAEKDTQ